MTEFNVSEVAKILAPSGTLRAAINLGNAVLAQRDPTTTDLQGVSVDLAREIGVRLGITVVLVPFEAAGKVFAALSSNTWDLAFLAVDPTRGEQISFTKPYVLIEGTYMIRADSELRSIDDVDKPGSQIAVGKGAAYDLYLTRTLSAAELVRMPTAELAFDHFLNERLDAAAGVRQILDTFAKRHNGLRVMESPFMVIEQAIGIPKARSAGLGFLSSVIEELKKSGFVEDALARSGQAATTVAP